MTAFITIVEMAIESKIVQLDGSTDFESKRNDRVIPVSSLCVRYCHCCWTHKVESETKPTHTLSGNATLRLPRRWTTFITGRKETKVSHKYPSVQTTVGLL